MPREKYVFTYEEGDPACFGNPKLFSHVLIERIIEELGLMNFFSAYKGFTKIQYDVYSFAKMMIFGRVLNPASKLATVRQNGDYYDPILDDGHNPDNIYDTLTFIAENHDKIIRRMNTNLVKKAGRSPEVIYYDVTNFYYDIEESDEDEIAEDGTVLEKGMRKMGVSKENKKQPIVQMGLFMELFRGNLPDVSTYSDAIEQVKKQFGIEKVVVVADKAMNSGNNIIKTSNNNDGWLFSQKHRGKKGVCKELQTFILDPSDWQFNEDVTFGQKSMIRKRIIKTTTKPVQTKTVTEKVLVTWSQKYANREQIRRDSAVDYAKKLTNPELFRETCKKGGKRYLELYTLDKETNEKKPFAPFIEINQEAIDFDAQFDGINVLVTSETSMSDEEILGSYKELAKIEDSFKVTKTEFDSRPVYVYKPEHIQAHFLSCFLALVLMRMLQYKIDYKMSPQKIIKALQTARANPITNGFYRVQANDDMKFLNELVNLRWEKAIVTYEQLNAYSLGVFTTT
jgi:hypothetical protein